MCIEGIIITDGSLMIDAVRRKRDTTLGNPRCPALESCCKLKNVTNEVETSTAKGGEADALNPNEINQNGVGTQTKCGFRNKDGLDNATMPSADSSQFAKFAEFPWMVAVLVETMSEGQLGNVYNSGGSLINPKVVLTAAHSTANIDKTNLIVRAGEWDVSSENENLKHEDRKVQKVIKHERFERANLQNDVALMILESQFEMTSHINTVCLPPKGSTFDGERCLASGWGKTKLGIHESYPQFLKKIEMPIVPFDECQTKLRETRLTYHFLLHSGFICAGNSITWKVSTRNKNDFFQRWRQRSRSLYW